MPHTLREGTRKNLLDKCADSNFTLMREAYLQNSRFERFLVFQAKSKANASFNQYVIARRYARFSDLTSRRGTRYYILFFYLLFSNLLFEVICSITDLTASFLLPSADISGEGDEDCLDKADAQSRFLWQD